MIRKLLILFGILSTLFSTIFLFKTPVIGQSTCNPVASILLLQDNSDSMLKDLDASTTRKQAAQDLAIDFVNKVDFAKDRMGLGLFADTASIVDPIGSSKTTIINDLSTYASEHGTELDIALNTAYNAVRTAPGKKYIILITDGKHSSNNERTAAEKDAAAIAAATTIKNNGITIMSVAIIESDKPLLTQIASSGEIYDADNKQQFIDSYNKIAGKVVCSGPTATPTPTPAPQYTITGSVFLDTNKNRRQDVGEINYAEGITINATGGSVTTNNGSFTISDLTAGTYTISYQSLPNGYNMIYPLNGPPPSFFIRIGPGCNVDSATGASCSARGDIINLDFAISNSMPWIQSIGADMRMDSGYVNPIPVNPACGTGAYASIPGNSNTPGIIFTGDQAPEFGEGAASNRNWVVGGSTYKETYRPNRNSLSSSYTALLITLQQAGTAITDMRSLPGCSNLNNCRLPDNLQSGAYQANGTVTLNSVQIPNNRNIIILINGDLIINGRVRTPIGSTVIFSAARDIVVSQNVGDTPACVSGNNKIEGIFSANRNFIVQGINNCTNRTDKMLRIEGAVIINAALTNGQFINNRDLCGNNLLYPTILFVERPDFILNAPEVIRRKSIHYQEIAP